MPSTNIDQIKTVVSQDAIKVPFSRQLNNGAQPLDVSDRLVEGGFESTEKGKAMQQNIDDLEFDEERYATAEAVVSKYGTGFKVDARSARAYIKKHNLVSTSDNIIDFVKEHVDTVLLPENQQIVDEQSELSVEYARLNREYREARNQFNKEDKSDATKWISGEEKAISSAVSDLNKKPTKFTMVAPVEPITPVEPAIDDFEEDDEYDQAVEAYNAATEALQEARKAYEEAQSIYAPAKAAHDEQVAEVNAINEAARAGPFFGFVARNDKGKFYVPNMKKFLADRLSSDASISPVNRLRIKARVDARYVSKDLIKFNSINKVVQHFTKEYISQLVRSVALNFRRDEQIAIGTNDLSRVVPEEVGSNQFEELEIVTESPLDYIFNCNTTLRMTSAEADRIIKEQKGLSKDERKPLNALINKIKQIIAATIPNQEKKFAKSLALGVLAHMAQGFINDFAKLIGQAILITKEKSVSPRTVKAALISFYAIEDRIADYPEELISKLMS